MQYNTLKKCIICNNDKLIKYLDLGSMPLVNDYHDNDKKITKFQISINLCPNCFHSQQEITVLPDILFKNYNYMTGISNTTESYFDWFVQYTLKDNTNDHISILDIASNDGTLLKHYKKRGYTVQGVDPATNICAIANNCGIPTFNGYWNEETSNKLNKKYDIIIAMNVLAHIENPIEFLTLCKRNLTDNGKLYIQTSQADIFKNFEFDTMYHEHISFFTANSFKKLFDIVNLKILNVQKTPIHGNSYLWTLGHNRFNKQFYLNLYKEEEKLGYYDINTYYSFNNRIQKTIKHIKLYVSNKKVIGFGAAAKGILFLNISNIKLEYIIDNTPLKINKYIPGMNTIIKPIESLLNIEDNEIYILVLAWNYYNEIRNKVSKLLPNKRITFIRYFPEFSTEEGY
jgi:SAM-dependent methyltransferase